VNDKGGLNLKTAMDTTENIIKAMEAYSLSVFDILDGKDSRGSYADASGNVQNAIDKFRLAVTLIPDGNYVAKLSDKPTNHNGATRIPFYKGNSTQNVQPNSTQNTMQTNNLNFEEILIKAKEQAKKELEWEQMKKDIEMLKGSVRLLFQSVLDGMDEDPKNDKDTKSMLEDAAENLEKVSKTANSFKGVTDTVKSMNFDNFFKK
jgi:hypothetical protein